MKNKKGFTLLEVLLSVVILGMFIGIIINIYIQIRGSDGKISNKRILAAESSDLIDLIHEAAIEYSIDYEEYFNRSALNYGVGSTGFTSYGNIGNLYYCYGNTYINSNSNYKVYLWDDDAGGCVFGDNQKYLEYYFQHLKLDNPNKLNSSGNKNSYKGKGPVAINPNTGLDYLYLISDDGTERYYFRRVYVTGADLNGDGETGKNEQLYTVQMLKLKGFDAGKNHDYKARGAYDGFIDTRACDVSQGYYCHGNTGLDNGYSLPLDYYDGWINITSDKVTVSDMKIDIYPIKDPYLATQESNFVIDPYAKISFTMNIFGEESKASNDEITLTTTLSFKNSYSRFPIVEYTGYYGPTE